PFYTGFSPRLAGAWTSKFTNGILSKLLPSGKTVIRGGYNRIYARMNGINLVQVPLQGTGIGQPVTCIGASRTGQCLGAAGIPPPPPSAVGGGEGPAPLPWGPEVRPQPFSPGAAGAPPAGTSWVLDPKIKPPHTDQFDFTIQRELSPRLRLELGYV